LVVFIAHPLAAHNDQPARQTYVVAQRLAEQLPASLRAKRNPSYLAVYADFFVDPATFEAELLRRYADEVDDIWLARCKVRAVS
jgi:hypothetical protein